jgi:hypothetical protein
VNSTLTVVAIEWKNADETNAVLRLARRHLLVMKGHVIDLTGDITIPR